jgi:O-antigen/teichoic acid export membrane protein
LISIAAAGILPFVLPSLVGIRYAPAAAAAQILLVGSAVYSAFFWLRPVFLACGWIRQWMTCFALFAFCNLIGWLVIVPKEGYLGMSAWRTLSIIATYTTPTLIVWMVKVGHEKRS